MQFSNDVSSLDHISVAEEKKKAPVAPAAEALRRWCMIVMTYPI
jgi:hypothetical protein